MKTGEVVASMPVLDDLPEGYQVAVENAAIVYDDGEGTVSTIVCNWFGAGNAGLADPNSDSSIQSYANIYDQNWLMKGNVMIAPDVERVDTMKTDNGYEIRYVCRQQRQCALLPDRLSGTASFAGPFRLSARNALPQGRS